MIVRILMLLLICISCSNDHLPDGILPEARMREVLWDVMRTDEWVNYESVKDSSLNKYQRSMEMYAKVFRIHKITEAQFRKSFQYYEAHPKLLKPVFDSLQQRANRLSPLESTVR